ncbi:MAG: hypothetical protein NUV77_10705 [Thermoguttaceae bacterium]|jgi:hypothetical protein|nr:hypothetical protein [Thermoguttaceae bacterium]
MAKKQLDVYRDWLGITETARPLNHYQLLKLKLFEDDAAKIRAAYRQLNAHVRRYATGEYGPQSQALLNELTKAMLCLTDAQRKREYDVTLGRKEEGEGRRRSFEETLLANKVLTAEQLNKARAFSLTVGLEMRDAVLQQRLATPEAVMQCFAESLGLPYVELGEVNLDESLIRRVPATLARQYSCIPVMVDDNQLLVASPIPLVPAVEDQLRLRFGMPVRSVLCTPRSINELLPKYYSKEAMAAAAYDAAAAAAAAKQAAAKQGAAKQAATAAKKSAPAAAPAEEDTDEPAAAGQKNPPWVIAGIVVMGLVILFLAYKMLFG